MRKTDYFSAEFNRYGVNSDRIENKVGYSIKKKMGNKENYLYKDKASQIDAIKKIFDEVIQFNYFYSDFFRLLCQLRNITRSRMCLPLKRSVYCPMKIFRNFLTHKLFLMQILCHQLRTRRVYRNAPFSSKYNTIFTS